MLANGLNLGSSCAILEPKWAEVRAKWVQVGPRLGPCWAKLNPSGCCSHVGSKHGTWTMLSMLSRSAKSANFQQSPCTCWRPAERTSTPAAEAVPVEQICSLLRLLNYHSSTPSVRWISGFQVGLVTSSSVWLLSAVFCCLPMCPTPGFLRKASLCLISQDQ